MFRVYFDTHFSLTMVSEGGGELFARSWCRNRDGICGMCKEKNQLMLRMELLTTKA